AERPGVAPGRGGGRGDRAYRTRAKGGRAEREYVKDPGRELEREREDESRDSDEVDGRRERRHPPRRREEAEDQRGGQIKKQYACREREPARAAEEDQGAAARDRREPDKQVGTLACLVDGCGATHLL